ncbi:DUF6266 family protein [Plebeiibacterium marinum]|uniref:DUF6266 family protein n=1 Tax=Plebeiibacterium marinum TaxID=2992111 RepID=A0AAE3SJH5_9BACT|nr:DUF6266 family protein [Plebeiobacterium marinum]MCW3805403.1 DUF6266 family protein [Plebeiobacterium marinum]
MGKYNRGINGEFLGKIGSTVGSTWKGISYMKALPKLSNKKGSARQIAQRTKFRVAAKFLQPLYPVVDVGFRQQDFKRSPKNAALSELMKYAMTGENPDFKIDLNSLVLSLGSLRPPSTKGVSIVDGQIIYTWGENENAKGKYDSNGVIIVAIAAGVYPEFSINDFTRGQGAASLYLPDAPTGAEIHCYLAFMANDGSMRVSNSIHVGTVIMP